MAQHVFKSTSNPASAPTALGQHFVNTSTKATWISVGTSTVADWLSVSAPSAIEILARYETAVNYTVTSSDYLVAVTDTSAPRAITLPLASSVDDGFAVTIKDESGAAGTNNISVTKTGADTIDGVSTVSISVNYGVLKIYSNGVDKWFSL